MNENDLDAALKMRHWEAAFLICVHLDEDAFWQRAGEAAIKCLETSSAALFYRHIQHAGMVMSLLELSREEDTALLTGNCFMLLSQFDAAQDHFLKSSNPLAALDMRRDLQVLLKVDVGAFSLTFKKCLLQFGRDRSLACTEKVVRVLILGN